MLLVIISRTYLIREHTVLIVDPIAVHYYCNAEPFFIFRLIKFFAFVKTHVPSSPSSTELNKCTHFKSFRGHQQLTSPPPSRLRYSTYIVLLSNTIGESIPCVLCTNKVQVRLFCLLITFLFQPNTRVACFSFVRHVFSTSHEEGRWMHASLALSISIISEFR